MQLTLINNLRKAHEDPSTSSKVTAMTWSPNCVRLATVATDRIVALYDESGERRDRFSTKAGGPSSRGYAVKSMAFSPDSTRIALAQSDNIVYVYKLGAEWGEKKSICNKFPDSSPVMALAWPRLHSKEFVYGTAAGKVKIANLRTNKVSVLYTGKSPVVSMTAGPDGHGVLIGHLDGKLHLFSFDNGDGRPLSAQFAVNPCPATALAWGSDLANAETGYIVAAGPDRHVRFYTRDGLLAQDFDYSSVEEDKDVGTAVFSPSGTDVIVGSFNRLRAFTFQASRGTWVESDDKQIDNLYSVSALAWKPDGSRVAVGSQSGAIGLYDACVRRQRYRGKFEFTYLSSSSVVVSRLASGDKVIVRSKRGFELANLQVFQDRYVTARTPETLLLADLNSGRTSEIPWAGAGNERFIFDNDGVAMVYHAGELALVEYGQDTPLGSCRTEHVNPLLISCRLGAAEPDSTEPPPRHIAYLIDMTTIQVQDLNYDSVLATVNHDSRIDWLELNTRGTILLFRDNAQQLHLYDVQEQQRRTLLNYCSYVQWVPDSDVVVAQNRGSLCVWYSIESPDRVSVIPIQGDVTEIEREPGAATHVVVDQGSGSARYQLDEALIRFRTAVDRYDFDAAVDILDSRSLSDEVEAMWRTLADLALEHNCLHVAERCYAALGDVTKTVYLARVNAMAARMAEQDQTEGGSGSNGATHFAVRAKLAALRKQFKVAELTLVEQGQVGAAMAMYQDLQRWDDALKVAESCAHPDLDVLRKEYYTYLLTTHQEARAAELKQRDGEYDSALNLYLKAGLPAKAAHLISARKVAASPDVLERIAGALYRAGLYDKAGGFFEQLGMQERALEAYRKGNAFRAAIDLARNVFPDLVVQLEEAWGDYLVAQKQVHASVPHYIEAGQQIKALDAAVSARIWHVAEEIVASLAPQDALPYLRRIGEHHEREGDARAAERFYAMAGNDNAAIDMHIKAERWDDAYRVACDALPADQVAALFAAQATRLETLGKLADAEKAYVWAEQPDMAINMYKRCRRYDDMLRLVKQLHPELLPKAHLSLARQFEGESNLRQAETHFVAAGDWKGAVRMYCEANLWDDAARVAKAQGGANAARQVVFGRAIQLGPEEATNVLARAEAVDAFLDWCVKKGNFFDLAVQVATRSSRPAARINDLRLKHACALEDAGEYAEAEAQFVQAGKPKEAIEMHIHRRDWPAATAVAEQYDPPSLVSILVAQAGAAAEKGDWSKAESLYLRAQQPEALVDAMKAAGMTTDAMRIAKLHCPHKLADATDDDSPDLLVQAGQYARALDRYISLLDPSTPGPADRSLLLTRALDLTRQHLPQRLRDVSLAGARWHSSLGSPEDAARVLGQGNLHREAVDTMLAAGLWDAARSHAQVYAPQLEGFVEEQTVLRQAGGGSGGSGGSNGGAGRSSGAADTMAEIEQLARRGDWDACLVAAAAQGEETRDRFILMRLRDLAKDGKAGESMQMLAQYGVPMVSSAFTMYAQLATQVLSAGVPEPETVKAVHSVLYQLAQQDSSPETQRLLQLTHLLDLRNSMASAAASDKAVATLRAKIAVSLVRYTDRALPLDRIVYDAALEARECGWPGLAFNFGNRYIDVSEAIDDGQSDLPDNSEFVETDVPFTAPIPSAHSVDEAAREDMRTWVLEASLDAAETLPTATCDNCSGDMYQAGLQCHVCATKYQACCVTGYPVHASSQISCRSCNHAANRNDWNAYITRFKACPFCGTSQTPSF